MKASDRFIIKKDFGIVRGKPVEVTIVPKDIKTEDMVKDDFAKIGKEIKKRRRSISFENFDQFKNDLRVVAVLEAGISANGETDYFCNCSYPNLPSGVKGEGLSPHLSDVHQGEEGDGGEERCL